MVISDLAHFALRKLPLSDLKKLIKVLQDNYKCRMIVNYVVNAPSSVSWIWTMIKGLINEHTVKKIKIQKDSKPKGLFDLFAVGQIEEKYGGDLPNRTQFWPLVLPDGPFHAEGEDPTAHLS